MRDNLAEVTNLPLATLNGQPAECRYDPAGDGAPQTLAIVPRLVGEVQDRSFAVVVALQRRAPAAKAPEVTPWGESIFKVMLRVRPGEVLAARLDGPGGEQVLVLVEPRELREE
jgi:hypothetical protein